MKKLIGFYGLTILSYFAAIWTAIWTIVSFILYLVKDTKFDWNSLYWFIACAVIMIIAIIGTFVTTFKNQ